MIVILVIDCTEEVRKLETLLAHWKFRSKFKGVLTHWNIDLSSESEDLEKRLGWKESEREPSKRGVKVKFKGIVLELY